MEDDDKILRSRLCAKMLSVSEVVHISSGGFLSLSSYDIDREGKDLDSS